MMTTMAALLGALPLALEQEWARSCGGPRIAIVGGLIVSQLLTLYTTPVIYLAFDRLARRFRRDPRVNISAPFIKRPVATTLLTIGLAVSGCWPWGLLPVSPLPQVDFPRSSHGDAAGAQPDTMATSWRPPLERQFGHIAGLTEMTSTSISARRASRCSSTFPNIDGAARDVQAAITRPEATCRPTSPNNPSYRKVNPAPTRRIMIVALTSVRSVVARCTTRPPASCSKSCPSCGVGQVIVGGSSLPAVRVEMNPLRSTSTASRSRPSGARWPPPPVRPKGQLGDGARASEIASNDQAPQGLEYAPVIIAFDRGAGASQRCGPDRGLGRERAHDRARERQALVLLVIFRQRGQHHRHVDGVRPACSRSLPARSPGPSPCRW